LDQDWLDAFRAALSRVNLVSFDVFDTAITRRCDAPVDTFALAEERLQGEIGDDARGFATARELAEQDARIAARARGREEITFGEIYAVLPRRLAGAARHLERMKSAELEAEAELLCGVPDILEAVRLALGAGRKVIFVSDMYLSGAQIRQFLEQAGYTDIGEVLASSDTGRLKWSGQQWASLRERLGSKIRILHVGDDQVADVEAPREHGIETLAFTSARSNRRVGGPLGPAVLPFSRAARDGQIRRRTDRRETSQLPSELPGELTSDFMAGFGASWGAVVVGSFIRWLEDRVQRYGIEHLLFLARDGWLLQRAWEAAGCTARTAVPASYLHVSRRTLNLAEAGGDFTEQALSRLCNTFRPRSLHAVLGRAGLLGCSDLVAEAAAKLGGLNETVTWPAGIETLRSLLRGHWPAVQAALGPVRDGTLGYLAQHVPDCRRLGMVDLGWGGSLQASLAGLLPEAGRDVVLSGFYYSLFPEAQQRRPYAGWLEGAFGNDFIPLKDQFGVQSAVPILENLHSAPEGTTVNYRVVNSAYVPVLGDSAVEKAQHAALIAPFQQGTLEAVGELFTTGRLGAVRLENLTPAAGRAAIERVGLSPSRDELAALGQIRHSADFDHAVFTPLVPSSREAGHSPLQTEWPVGAALTWLGQGHDRSHLAALLRNAMSETDFRTIRQFT
jgi:FMN phosphatase YigB (HAD superfamily)